VNENQIHGVDSNVTGVFIGGNHLTMAIDPGVLTFGTCYDIEGKVVEWGGGGVGGRCVSYLPLVSYHGQVAISVPPNHHPSQATK
jgi:hypothetical protein